MTTASLFKPDVNCWRHATASFAAPVVDCENYYRALHEAFSRARHSIFIVGWDIDSRIRLLRGEEERAAELPSVVSDLLAQCARDNPDLQVYLLRWDSSLAFLGMRELWAKEVWDEKTPDNVHVQLDATIPMGGSQHQKIVIIDDEVAFSGGMDIAVHRWDTRDHRPIEAERVEEDGPYGPLHDVQCVVAGPIVGHLAELVRWRWKRLARKEAVAIRDEGPQPREKTPRCWPLSVSPLFQDIDCAIARTIPFMDDAEPKQEVRRMLLDLIDRAEDLIYIENQFASRQEIAERLNERLKKCPNLRVLLVSSYEPEGTVEREAYWASRVDFKKILEAGVEPERILMASSSYEDDDGNTTSKRVHSKVMTIDDRYMVIGSANLSNRSMTLDTECDLVFEARSDVHREQIRQARDDLVLEHSGCEPAQLRSLLQPGQPLRELERCRGPGKYALSEVEDEQFTDQSLHAFMLPFSDPEEPLVPPLTLFNGKRTQLSNPSKKVLIFGAAILIIALLVAGGYYASQHVSWLNADAVQGFLESTRGTYWALPAVCGIYVLAGILFFPVTVLSVAVAAVFGPLWGPIYGMAGALCSAALLFGVGQAMGGDSLSRIGGSKVKRVDQKFKESGIIGVAAIRVIPIAPFSLVNLVAGFSSIRFYQFMMGTFLGMAPLMVAKGFVGDSLTQIVINPSAQNIGYLTGGIVFWIVLIFASQKLVNLYQQRKTS
ncbi:MAG: phospholipase [unclassified Hahellaceae]|nr:phospholipase [Hahellaceae bacterium]|tara:strand:- start:4226 stop:6379 length:2154 start_codon:yes stop_codon:yes gene_type:complete